MIITAPGNYRIEPVTRYNKIGNPYRLRVAEVTAVNKNDQKIYCKELGGWIDWNLSMSGEKKKKMSLNKDYK